MLHSKRMQLEEKLLNKVVETHDISEVSFGTALVGSSASAKTTALAVLQDLFDMISKRNRGDKQGAAARDLLSRLNMRGMDGGSEGLKHFSVSYAAVDSHTVNPKCLNVADLFGTYNEAKHAWVDGVVPSLVRAASLSTEQYNRHWIILDGLMDESWAKA